MWLVVAFDLPTTTTAARRSAALFRNALLQRGFERTQWSLYERRKDGSVDVLARDISALLPVGGDLWVARMTDDQHDSVARYRKGQLAALEEPQALVIF